MENTENEYEVNNLISLLNENNIEPLCFIETVEWRDDPIVYGGNNWTYSTLINYITNHSPLSSNYIQNSDTFQYYYQKSYNAAVTFVNDLNFENKIRYYNVGNEIAYNLVKKYSQLNPTEFLNFHTGEDIEDFFLNPHMAQRTIASIAFVKGLVDGVKLNDTDSEIIINDTYLNFGYFKLLNLINVNYDIIGWNWYFGENFNSPNDFLKGYNVYQSLVLLGNKPIWIIESNKANGSYYGTLDENASSIRSLMETMYSNAPNVKGFLIYELIDEKDENDFEDYFGLITTPIDNIWQYKPAFDTFRFTIEEFQHGYHDFVYSFYLKYKDENRNLLTDSGIQNWANNFKNGGNIYTTLNWMMKYDCRPIINNWYDKYLDRSSDQLGISYYFSKLFNENSSFEWVISDLVSSQEFYNKALTQSYNNSINYNNSEKFIRHAYMKLLNRLPDTNELNTIINNFENLNNRNQRRNFVLNYILSKLEYIEIIVKENFEIYLDRDVTQDPSGFQYHINNYLNHKEHIKILILSDEFWRKSIIRGYCYRQNHF